MSIIDGVGEAPAALAQGEPHRVKQSLTTGALLVELVTGGGPLPFSSWSKSGILVGQAVAVTGYAADKGDSLLNGPIQYARGVGTTRLKISVNVNVNSFGVATTTFEVFKNNVATGLLVSFVAGATGNQNATGNIAFGADVDTFDLRVTNPGNAADVGKTIEFGADIQFF